MLKEMLGLLAGSIPVFAFLNPTGFRFACAGALVLAAGLWWGCTVYVRLWNNGFRFTVFYHLLCAAASTWTIFSVLSMAGTGYVIEKIDEEIALWETVTKGALAADGALSRPSTTSASTLTQADLLSDFESSHPFLRRILLTAGVAAPEERLNRGFSSSQMVESVANTITSALRDHLETVFARLRAGLMLSFLVAQAVPFGIAGFMANRDIRPSL